MRVILLTRSFEIGGAEIQIITLAKGLLERGHEVSIACFYAIGPLLSESRAAGIKIIELEKKGRWDFIGFSLRLSCRLARESPDIVQSFLGPPNVLSAIAKNRLRGTRVIWGIRASDMALENYDWSWQLTTWLERMLSNRAAGIVTNSWAGQKVAVRRGLPEKKMVVIFNGIDIERFRPDPSAGASLRKEWGVSPDVPLIGLVARFDPMKDHQMFLRAAARILKIRPEVRFVCVGYGPLDYVESIKAQSEALGIGDQIIWAGARRDMPAVYNALKILALSSSYGEGFSNTLGEAMACGTLCTATDVGDASMIVADDRMIVARGDDEGLAKAWRILLEEDGTRLKVQRDRCRRRIENDFSVAAMVDAYVGLYERILGKSV